VVAVSLALALAWLVLRRQHRGRLRTHQKISSLPFLPTRNVDDYLSSPVAHTCAFPRPFSLFFWQTDGLHFPVSLAAGCGQVTGQCIVGRPEGCHIKVWSIKPFSMLKKVPGQAPLLWWNPWTLSQNNAFKCLKYTGITKVSSYADTLLPNY
jgi:hypothetical protein